MGRTAFFITVCCRVAAVSYTHLDVYKRPKLGDVAQSMCINANKGWVVVNNSHVIFAIDLNTFKEVGRITTVSYTHLCSLRQSGRNPR